MTTETRRNRSAMVLAMAMGSIMLGLAAPGTAEAVVPVVQIATNTTLFNSTSPKIAIAQCPFGTSVLGGAAQINRAEGQVAIQGAFPMWDAGLAKYTFVVKAIEDLSGTLDNWSVTATAYCTSTTVPLIVSDPPSAFDSNPIKSATVHCPDDMKVVGMGGDVSTLIDVPGAIVGNVPPASVVFQGFSANQDLTQVTARGVEESGALGGSVAGTWKVSAVAACASPVYFDGLELRANTERGGGFLADEIESQPEISCFSKDKRVIAAGSAIGDYDMEQWYLHRFSPYNAFQKDRLVADAYRNWELGTVLSKQTALIICTDK